MPNPILALGYVITGVGFFLEATNGRKKEVAPPPVPEGVDGARRLAGLGQAPKGAQPLPPEGYGIKKITTATVRTIDQRVSFIKEQIIKGSQSPKVIEKARAIVARKCKNGDGSLRLCVPEKDWWGEVKALFDAVADANHELGLRYTRDHLFVDQFSSAEASMRLRAGDCDDGTILLGSLLMSVGYNVKCRVIQSKGADSWSHIYLLVGLPPTGITKWVPLDWSVRKPAGWEVEGADQSARTGKPAGLVIRVKDYPVLG
jgi:hypothetical protein